MITLALVLTPIASARALAGLCALNGIEVDVVPTSRGAVAVRAVGRPEVEIPDDPSALLDAPPAPAEGEAPAAAPDWDIGELTGEDVPAEAIELAAALSRLARGGVVLVTAQLSQDSGVEHGLSGQLQARRFANGEAGEEVPAGLVLAGSDDVVEDLLLGRTSVTEVPGHVHSRDAGPGRRPRWFGRGPRRMLP